MAELGSGYVIVLVAVVVLSIVNVQSVENSYCTLCKDHTMCIYKGVGPVCAPKLSGGVDSKDKAAILKTHNDLRQRVAQGKETLGAPGPQPPAANMRMLAWDNELASVAQRLADQCVFKHDTCRKVKRFIVGQNIAWSGGAQSSDWPGMIKLWYNEVKEYSKAWIFPYKFSSATGHYTQVVWADTHLVGCGYTKYRKEGSTTLEQLYVCNYATAGNFNRGPLYEVGNAATKCPAGTSGGKNGYPGLCS